MRGREDSAPLSAFIIACPSCDALPPHLALDDDAGRFACRACGSSGDLFDYVMETRGLTFAEAVLFLTRETDA